MIHLGVHTPDTQVRTGFNRLLTDLLLFQGSTIIMMVIDCFLKACHLIPLPKLQSALEMVETIFHYVFRPYALPEDNIYDQSLQFASWVWKKFCNLLNINVSLTSRYHPQSNSQTECLNQEVSHFLLSNQFYWCWFLLWREYAQNSM